MVKLASLACSRSVAFVKALRGSYNHESTRQARIYYCVLIDTRANPSAP